MQVREIMTENPACCTPDSGLQEISKMMVENDCGCIPVVENKNNMKPVGTVTDRDITIRTVAAGKNPLEMKASDIMTSDVVTIKPESNIHECANVMKEKDIRRVLVVDKNGGCCGIVAQADVAEYGPNPNLISNVVHDISESAHTPVKSDSSNFSEEKSEDGKNSLLSLGTVLPLAAGVAAGAAYKYFYGSSGKIEKNDVEKFNSSNFENKMDFSDKTAKMNLPEQNCDIIAVAAIPVTEENKNTFSDQKTKSTEFGHSATQR